MGSWDKPRVGDGWGKKVAHGWGEKGAETEIPHNANEDLKLSKSMGREIFHLTFLSREETPEINGHTNWGKVGFGLLGPMQDFKRLLRYYYIVQISIDYYCEKQHQQRVSYFMRKEEELRELINAHVTGIPGHHLRNLMYRNRDLPAIDECRMELRTEAQENKRHGYLQLLLEVHTEFQMTAIINNFCYGDQVLLFWEPWRHQANNSAYKGIYPFQTEAEEFENHCRSEYGDELYQAPPLEPITQEPFNPYHPLRRNLIPTK